MVLFDILFFISKSILYFVAWWIILIVILLSAIWKIITVTLIKLQYRGATLLDSNDVLISYGESVETSRFLTAFLCSGTVDIESFRSILLEKFVKPNFRFQCTIEKKYGYFFFAKEKNFNIEEHVLYRPEFSVSNKEDWKKVQTNLYFEPIPKHLSPWFFHFIPLNSDFDNETAEPKFYMVLSMDHSFCDAYSGLRILLKAISDFEPPEPLRPNVRNTCKWEKYLTNIKLSFFGLYILEESFMHKKKLFDVYEKNGPLKYSESGKLNITTIKEIKNAMNLSFKEILVTCIAAALDRYFRQKKREISSEMILCLPEITWKPEDKITPVNKFFALSLHLPLKNQFCVDRLKEVNEILHSKFTQETNAGYAFIMENLLNLVPAFICQKIYRRFEITTQFSITGTDRLPEFILGKRRMTNQVQRIIPILTNTAFGFQINSLGNDVFISTFTKLKFVKEEDLDIILRNIEMELEDLKKHILK